MRLLIVALAALPLTAATAEPPAPVGGAPKPIKSAQIDAKKQCPKELAHQAGPNMKGEFRKLGELPPADAFHAVYRLDSQGCIDPVMVGYQYGRRFKGAAASGR